MIKTLKNALKQNRGENPIPRKVQDIIPVRTVYPDGIFLSGKNTYSRSYRFRDINYAVASRAVQEAMFLGYSGILNSFDSGATTKITANNRSLNLVDFERDILLDMKNDRNDCYRRESNGIMRSRATGADATVQDKYVTISVVKNSIEDARVYF